MTITFYSNFLNHHQLPLCLEFNRITNGRFHFVATTPIPEERLSMGYEDMNKSYPFVLTTYDSDNDIEIARKLAVESDIVIHGAAPEEYVAMRMIQGKQTFRFLERPNKRGFLRSVAPKVLANIYKNHIKYRNAPLYVLCASAYTAPDFNLYRCYINKCFKWGYFPEVKQHDIDDLFERKDPALIVWAGRLLDLKHPETAVYVAAHLKENGIPFRMNIIGSGEKEEQLASMIQTMNLSDQVKMLGSMPSSDVRKYMEQASIFLFTSNKKEGWGAVLNESMNSGCAVVANNEIGSVPFLIKHGQNGYIYHKGNVRECCEQVLSLMRNREERLKAGKNAYQTIRDEWSAKIAAERVITLSQYLHKNQVGSCYPDGVCSCAPIVIRK